MALIRIGHEQPFDARTGSGPHAYHTDGMHYELCYGDHGQLYVVADHEDVGLYTWYYASREDWQDLYNASTED